MGRSMDHFMDNLFCVWIFPTKITNYINKLNNDNKLNSHWIRQYTWWNKLFLLEKKTPFVPSFMSAIMAQQGIWDPGNNMMSLWAHGHLALFITGQSQAYFLAQRLLYEAYIITSKISWDFLRVTLLHLENCFTLCLNVARKAGKYSSWNNKTLRRERLLKMGQRGTAMNYVVSHLLFRSLFMINTKQRWPANS